MGQAAHQRHLAARPGVEIKRTPAAVELNRVENSAAELPYRTLSFNQDSSAAADDFSGGRL